LEAAKDLFEQSRLPVEDIAKETGFGDRERMRRAFIRIYGEAPRSKRINAGPRATIALRAEPAVTGRLIYPRFRAVTFQELESIITPFGCWYRASSALSALAISSWRSSPSLPGTEPERAAPVESMDGDSPMPPSQRLTRLEEPRPSSRGFSF
jgi:hypothetical protein